MQTQFAAQRDGSAAVAQKTSTYGHAENQQASRALLEHNCTNTQHIQQA
jgi:hypothetical protein